MEAKLSRQYEPWTEAEDGLVWNGTVAEVAAMLGRSEGAVYSRRRLHRGPFHRSRRDSGCDN